MTSGGDVWLTDGVAGFISRAESGAGVEEVVDERGVAGLLEPVLLFLSDDLYLRCYRRSRT
jgi:hypothetical protein